MKKLIGLVIILVTFVTLSASAQCGTATEKPRFYGDFSPCKNQKNVIYTIANINPANPIKWVWCRGIPGALPSTGFVPTEFRWNFPSMTTATDGSTTVSGGYLYTNKLSIAVNYKTRGGYLGCYFKDSCGVWQELYGRTISITCDPVDDPYAWNTTTTTATIDTGVSLINARVIHATYDMSLNFDSISGLPGPHTNINMFWKSVGGSASCNSYGANYFPDGYYITMRFSPQPTLPFISVYGYNLYYTTADAGPRTFRVTGVSANGKAWQSLPFTIASNYYTNILYPLLPQGD